MNIVKVLTNFFSWTIDLSWVCCSNFWFFSSGVYYDPFLAAQAATATPLQVNPVSKNTVLSPLSDSLSRT